jgi:hypothetical protein
VREIGEAMPTVLDFEDLAPWTSVTAQYGPRGVLFQNNYLDTDPAAHSGTHVLRTVKPSDEVFEPLPLVLTFTSAQSRVKLFAASFDGIALNGTLTAFDAADNVVAQDGPKLVAANVFTTMFEVTDPDATPSITRAELRLENGIHFAIDDLEFEGEPPTQPPEPPVVEITAPANGAELDVSTVDIAGTVTGEGLLSPVQLTLIYGRPPESTAPPFTSVLDLIGTGTTRHFSLPGFSGVPLGPITVTVTAQNFGALTGTASVTVTNLPIAIRDRFTAEGGVASLGAFGFGLFADGCKIAVYELGAISADSAGETRIIRGEILAKWRSLRGSFNTTGIGCPLGEERDGPSGSRAQDFQEGRIYSHPTIGTFSVPAVFVDAIDKRGGEEATGIPIAEPTSSSGPMQTWLFQRFTRPNWPDLEPSTLEIRGTPPVLTMERQGGNLSYPGPGGGSTEFSATLWESFTCTSTLGPCSVDPTPEEPPPIADAGNLFCQGTTYPWGPPEWAPILGHYISTPIFGVAVDSHLAHFPPGDNPLSHEMITPNCPIPGNLGCPSDWNVQIWPIGPQRGIAPFTSIKAENTYVELEWEDYYGWAAWLRKDLMEWDWPRVGDLIFAAGRWIIDCGHTPYRSELHPVFMLALMKGVQFQGRLATRADIWVNGWYPGDPIEFDIFPPPRPTPESVLTLNKPLDAEAAFNVDLEFDLAPASASDHIHVKFTASPRQVHVTDAGEMKWETERAYEGQWFVSWSS